MLRRTFIFVIIATFTLAATTQNSAWGQEEPSPELAPAIRYVVATPRACLLPVPDLYQPQVELNADGAEPSVIRFAATENFPRKDGGIRIPAGTRMIVALSRQTEGVWYPKAFGTMATRLLLEMAVQDPCTNAWTWIPVGSDEARDTRMGPSIGRALVRVPVRFPKPGIYKLRARVTTVARPLPKNDVTPDVTDTAADSAAGPGKWPRAIDTDTVIIRVHVVEATDDDITQPSDFAPHPERIYNHRLPNVVDDEDPDLEADVTGDEVVNWLDLAVIVSQWTQQAPGSADDMLDLED